MERMDIATGIKGFVFGLTILLTVALNGAVLVTFMLEKRPRFSTKCIHVLVTNLAVCQLAIGFLVMPFTEVSIFNDAWKQSKALCQFNGFTTSTCFYTAVLMLCAISLDRYVAIVLATKYQKLLTKKRGCVIVTLIWLTASLLSMPPLIGWSSYNYHPGTLHCSPVWIGQCSYFYFTFTISVTIPMTMTVFSYVVIFWKVRTHRKRVSTWKHAGGRNDSSKNDGNAIGFEMSQIATVNKSPGVKKKESLIEARQIVAPYAEVDADDPTLNQRSASQFLNEQKWRNGPNGPGEKQMKQLQERDTKQRLLTIASHDIFPDPKTSDSANHATKSSEPMKDVGYQNDEGKMSTNGLGEESRMKITATDKEAGYVNHAYLEEPTSEKGTMHQTTNKEEAVGSERLPRRGSDANRVAADEMIENKQKEKKSKKPSVGRLLTLNHAQKNEPMRLNENDTISQLNVSETSNSLITSSESTTEMVLDGAMFGSNTKTEEANNLQDANKCRGIADKTTRPRKNKISAKTMSVVTSLPKKATVRRNISHRSSKLRAARRTLREFQVAKTGAILLVVFMVCYGPYTVVHLCNLPFPVPLWTQHLGMWCVFMNSFLTPIIYGLMNRETRKKMRVVMTKCCTSK